MRLTSHAGKGYVCLGVKGQGETDKSCRLMVCVFGCEGAG